MSEDTLTELIELQKQFQLFLKIELPTVNIISSFYSKQNIERIKNQILALLDETMEALNEVPWKPWKHNQEFNIYKFRMELIDIFHFLINLFIFSGMNTEMIKFHFLKKNQINIKRQKNGY